MGEACRESQYEAPVVELPFSFTDILALEEDLQQQGRIGDNAVMHALLPENFPAFFRERYPQAQDDLDEFGITYFDYIEEHPDFHEKMTAVLHGDDISHRLTVLIKGIEAIAAFQRTADQNARLEIAKKAMLVRGEILFMLNVDTD